MKTVVIIQARLGSTRLPGKVLLELGPGKTVLDCMLDRVKRSRLVDEVLVATTDSLQDYPLVKWLESRSQKYFKGSEQDVLDRYYNAAKAVGMDEMDVVVRLTADCPLIDPHVIDEVIQFFRNNSFDYVSNGLEPYTYPDGMDTEVFSFALLERAWQEAIDLSYREHVTFHFWKNPDIFRIGKYVNKDISQGQFRLTLDYVEDLALIRDVYRTLMPKGDFTMDDIIQYLVSNPKVRNCNVHFKRNESWHVDDCSKKQ